METEVSSYRRLDFDKVDQITNDEVSTPPVLNVIKDINKIHTLIPFELIPKMGMEFESEEDAYNFYLAYAKEVGFGIKRSSFHKDSNGKLMDRVFCCSAKGKRGKDKRDLNVRAPRPETRFNCSAKMKVNSRQTGKFRICQLIIEHNHYLSSPNKSHLHISHRKINSIHAAEIDMAYRDHISLAFTKRYRDLCRLYTQLVTKAAQAEETYKIAKEGLLKILDLVDARLHQEGSSNEMSNAAKVSNPTNNTTNASGINIKGIKKKMKTISGKRLKSSLEKATKRRRSTKKSFQNSITMELPASSHNEVLSHYNFTIFVIQYFLILCIQSLFFLFISL
ncbi:unnamed protein product [Coffea canephora]|uniref:DH200=94 genomic scaffold, scaffold_151 n=1 Tax=Coffea canephora TaxID=49390 RepID=A0A068V959_COFCA|nr:unnamed protein product [Coffea canephora]